MNDRIAELRDAIDRRMSRRGIATHRQLVQVYDGGSIPTAVPAMFLARPVGIDVAEAEGATSTITPDTSQTIPVLVLGPEVPAAGDNLLATVISGRWLAEKQGAGGPPPVPDDCNTCFFHDGAFDTITVTDSNATFSAPFAGTSGGQPFWNGGYIQPGFTGVDSITDIGGGDYDYTIGSISIGIGYFIQCSMSEFSHALLVSRGWSRWKGNEGSIYCGDEPAPDNEYISNLLTGGNYCVSPRINPIGESVNGFPVITRCNPLAASGTLTGGAHVLDDPAPGLVTFTTTPPGQMRRWLRSANPDKVRHAKYRLMVMDDPEKANGFLRRDGVYVPYTEEMTRAIQMATPNPATDADEQLRAYIEKHGCGGC